MKINVVSFDPLTSNIRTFMYDLVSYTQWVERGALQGYKSKRVHTGDDAVLVFTSAQTDQNLVFTARAVEEG